MGDMVMQARQPRPWARRIAGAGVLIAGGLMAVPAVAQGDEVKAAEARGQALAQAQCAQCHAIGRVGESPTLADGTQPPAFPAIAARYDVWGLQEALAEGIMVGHEQMPEFALEPDQIGDLLTYMDTFTPAQ